jgi:hypothetical protein
VSWRERKKRTREKRGAIRNNARVNNI